MKSLTVEIYLHRLAKPKRQLSFIKIQDESDSIRERTEEMAREVQLNLLMLELNTKA